MPELPEVEIIKQSLERCILYKKIQHVLIRNKNLRFKIQKKLDVYLKGKKIIKVNRKSKYLILYFKENNFLLIHFGMSGTLHLVREDIINKTNLSFYHSSNLPNKHNHIEIFFSNFKLVYNDPRRFGFFKFFNSKKKIMNYLSNLGPEPFDKKFNYSYLKNKIYKKTKNIKNFLLDQNYISGIGNIYANEILYHSKIDPFKISKDLNDFDIKKIINFSKYVLNKAIKKGGSTIKDFKNSKGKSGLFQNEFKVYDRDGKKCFTKKCRGKIVKLFISNRSTYLCNYCQK